MIYWFPIYFSLMIFYITKRGENIKIFENSFLKNLFVLRNNLNINECKIL